MRIDNRGFTLIEICIAAGLVGILTLALSSINTLNAQSNQSIAATEEFNNEVSQLLSLLNATTYDQGVQNNCTKAFLNLPLANYNGQAVPQISASLPMPEPSPSGVYNAFTLANNPPVGIFMNGPIIQVTASSLKMGTVNFPPPKNNLWVTSLYFSGLVQANVLPIPLGYSPTLSANLYNLHLTAQKISSGNGVSQKMLGGETTYSKDFLVLLWVDGGFVKYCGSNLPMVAADSQANCDSAVCGTPTSCWTSVHQELASSCASNGTPPYNTFTGTQPDSLGVGVCCCYEQSGGLCP